VTVICESYSFPPSVCGKGPKILPIEETLISPGKILLIVIACIIAMLLIIYCYRKMLRRELHQQIDMQVKEAISQYYALNETKTKNKSDTVI